MRLPSLQSTVRTVLRGLTTTVLVVTVVYAAPAEASTGSAWIVQPTPPLPAVPHGQLNDVSCVSTECIAVGQTPPSSGVFHYTGFAERWDGHSWSLLQPLGPAMSGVSCTSTSFCMAVGGAEAQEWNGRTWSAVPISNLPSYAYLQAVACTTPAACTAVGDFGSIERWNGHTWSLQPGLLTPPGSGGSYARFLSGVSCPSVTSCVAVGNASGVSTTLPVAGVWNGQTWRAVRTATLPAGYPTGWLRGVSCLSSSVCTAVGSSQKETSAAMLAERWDGSTWTIQPTPATSPSAYSDLGSVSCTSTASCVAVGSSFTYQPEVSKTLVEAWDGSQWAMRPSPATGPTAPAFQPALAAVSCPTSTRCEAVGEVRSNTDLLVPLAETVNTKSASLQSSVAPLAPNVASLAGVSCPSATTCMAVGSSSGPSVAEEWNGTTWRLLPTDDPPLGAKLSSVACPTTGTCVAVGTYDQQGLILSVSEIWDGSQWHLRPTVNPAGSQAATLKDISCPSASSCVAVGSYQPAGAKWFQLLPLIEVWNGLTWRSLPSPVPTGEVSTVLSGVSCVGPQRCLAVGSYQTATTPYTLAELWNGSQWLLQHPVNVSLETSELNAVTCLSPTECVAAGDRYDGGVHDSTLFERWNGSTWTRQPSTEFFESEIPVSVSCTSATACVAVGGASTPESDDLPFADTWNGTTWTRDATPYFGSGRLNHVSCSPSAGCTAVGLSSVPAALVLRRTSVP